MNDLFETKNIKPMLIGATGEAFDSDEYLYELKWDGERCLAYLDPKNSCELRNKRNIKMLPKVPELSELDKQVKKKCILDGELMIFIDGKPDFFAIQRRSLMSNKYRIELAAKQAPATFMAFDCLYYNGENITHLPLMKRKEVLHKNVKENNRLVISPYFENKGIALWNVAKEQGLEGIVAKRKDSIYITDKRTKSWVKVKNLLDDDFIICGYEKNENNTVSLILGQYQDNKIIYRGHVNTGINGEAFSHIKTVPVVNTPLFPAPQTNSIIWLEPLMVCTVQYLQLTSGGGMRHPIFKTLRFDKQPQECIVR